MKKLKKIMCLAVAFCMLLGVSTINADAASVNTGVHSSSGPYTYYVRKSGSYDVLGLMHLSKSGGKVYTTFTASQWCGATTAYVSPINSGYASKSVASLSTNAAVTAEKSASGSMIYGYCTVSYN